MHDWMMWGSAAITSAVIATLIAARRGQWARSAFFVSLLNLLVAAMNSSAPFRGLLDPEYVGYRFGLIEATAPLAVFFVAGSVLLAASIASVLAATNNTGRKMLFIAVVDTALMLNFSGGLVAEYMAGTADFEIQFGEYLLIPSGTGLIIQIAVLILPLSAATYWALRRARQPEESQGQVI